MQQCVKRKYAMLKNCCKTRDRVYTQGPSLKSQKSEEVMLSGSPCRVLHVDDDPENQRTVADILQRCDSDTMIVTARTGTEAIEILQNEAFDIIVIEPWIAEVNGFKLCRHVKATCPATHVIFFAAVDHMNLRKFAEAAGAEGVFLATNEEEFAARAGELLQQFCEKN